MNPFNKEKITIKRHEQIISDIIKQNEQAMKDMIAEHNRQMNYLENQMRLDADKNEKTIVDYYKSEIDLRESGHTLEMQNQKVRYTDEIDELKRELKMSSQHADEKESEYKILCNTLRSKINDLDIQIDDFKNKTIKSRDIESLMKNTWLSMQKQMATVFASGNELKNLIYEIPTEKKPVIIDKEIN